MRPKNPKSMWMNLLKICCIIAVLHTGSCRLICGISCTDGAVLLLDNSMGESQYFAATTATPSLDAPIKYVSPYLRSALAYGGDRRGMHLLWKKLRKALQASPAYSHVLLRGANSHDSHSFPPYDEISTETIAKLTQRLLREQRTREFQKSFSRGSNTKETQDTVIHNALVVGLDAACDGVVMYEISPTGHSTLYSQYTTPSIALGSTSPDALTIVQALEQEDGSSLSCVNSVQSRLRDIVPRSMTHTHLHARLLTLATMTNDGKLSHHSLNNDH